MISAQMNVIRNLSKRIYSIDKMSRSHCQTQKIKDERNALLLERTKRWCELLEVLEDLDAPDDVVYIIRQRCIGRNTWLSIASELYIDLQFNAMMPMRRLEQWLNSLKNEKESG